MVTRTGTPPVEGRVIINFLTNTVTVLTAFPVKVPVTNLLERYRVVLL